LPAEQRFELATINPGLILGPAFVGAGFSSGEIIEQFITGKVPAIPKV
jgi:dihydroflavonol-4-reductase